MSRLAWIALLLALLVPARAGSLCCLTPVDGDPAAASHTDHHAAKGDLAGHDALSAASEGSECLPVTARVPAVRERGPTDDVGTLVQAAGPVMAAAPDAEPAVLASRRGETDRPAPLSRPLRI